MSTNDVTPARARSLVIPAAVTVGLLIMGDSFLYSALPVSAGALNLSLLQVSVLLSANRWIRLLSNSLVATLLVRLPLRALFAGAAGLGLLSTLAFAWPLGFASWLTARLAWGLAWSVFRQSAYHAVWTHQDSTHGRWLGSWWGLVRLGSGIGVLIGGLILDLAGFSQAMLGLSGLAVAGVLMSLPMVWPPHNRENPPSLAVVRTEYLNTWLRILRVPAMTWCMLLASGTRLCLTLTIALVSLYLQDRLDTLFPFAGVGVMAGLVLALHWVSTILAAPAVGAISDRVGRTRTIILMTLLVAIALSGAAVSRDYMALVSAGCVMLFFSGLRVAVEVGVNSLAQQDTHPHLVMGVYATLDDLSAALGPIIGLAWYRPAWLPSLLGGCAAVILLLTLGYVRSQQAQVRHSRTGT